MKSVTSLEMYEKLKLKDLNTTSIPHVVGASGKSLGARGRTKCEVNINGRIFYQMFIVYEHLKRPIILSGDFSIQNCIGISWTTRKPVGFMQSCCYVFVGILSTYKKVLLIISY